MLYMHGYGIVHGYVLVHDYGVRSRAESFRIETIISARLTTYTLHVTIC